METDSSMFLNLFLTVFLLLSNGFFVASEFAIVSVRKTRIAQRAKEGNTDAKIALHEIEHLDKTIAATQLGITISSIGLGWVAEATLVKIIEPLFAFLPDMLKVFATHSLAVAIAFIIVTFLHVVLGELMPKSVALQYPEKTTLVIARTMSIVTKIFTPFIFILNGFANWLLALFKVPPANHAHLVHTTEELDMIINESHKGGVLNDTEKEILQNVFKFSDTLAKQVMVPRPDVVSIQIGTTVEDINKIIVENQYTRYPVYSEDLDDILGILHIKDIYKLMTQGKDINLKEILREGVLVPETMTMDNLVLEFKEKKAQMALVIDEFGGVSGLITLEDVLEEIFGEVQDEFDEEEAEIRQIYENEYIANAMMRVDEFNEFFELNIDDEDVDTIGGLVVKSLGHIAKQNDEVKIDNFIFSVLEVDGARIVKIKIKKEDIQEPQGE